MNEHTSPDKEYRDKLLWMVKKEVKQIMEEAVTRKFVHEESSIITSLCAAVDACLAHGLKRRALGLFKTNSTTALLQKVSKNFELAAVVANMVAVIENQDPSKRSSSSSDSLNRLKGNTPGQVKKASSTTSPPTVTRYLWIRIALFEKHLAQIVDHLVQNSSKYFEKDALVADPVAGQILASLLVGPCALDYSKMKTADHLWTDPPADELVQRHRLSSGLSTSSSGKPTTPPSLRRLGLQYRRDAAPKTSSSGSEDRIAFTPREYVDSLHQNSKTTLLYGKNNVVMQPRDNVEAMPGYLSLHQNYDTLAIKWTPNQIMNGCCSSESSTDSGASLDKSIFWDYAFSIDVSNIVYLHCHQHEENGGTVVLVGLDGVQRPPIHFPKGGHLLTFLTCLETGLLPQGQLDPPLWSQRGKGKVFPKLKKRGKKSPSSGVEEEQADYVFRILTSLKPESISEELLDPKSPPERNNVARHAALRHHSSSTSSNGSFAMEVSPPPSATTPKPPTGQSIQILCATMKRQIISRAFYGWLAHCRHLKTVRTHLAGLVQHTIVSPSYPTDASKGLTADAWATFNSPDPDVSELYRLVYFGGVDHTLRKIVWPYLLGHFQLGWSSNQCHEHDASVRRCYETTMSEWLVVEAIVKQRDREINTAAKLSSESTEIPLTGDTDSKEEEEEVFEVSDADDSAHQDPRIESSGRKPLLRYPPLESTAEDLLHSDTSPVSPASSSGGGIYSVELLDQFSLNLHRIDKDVQRCDRNFWYFSLTHNLEKLRNIMCTYVWEHLDVGYVQGMCDLVAPLLVIFDDEMMTYSCFCELMKRMVSNFPNGGAMDNHFANMRSLIQILDAELFDLMHQNGDYTHFYFCYRWFLLDFKRELLYDDVFAVWEAIWAAAHVASRNFVLFLALALVEYYRDIILENNMDFTDIIRFFNEMAERHDAKAVLKIARDLVLQIQTLIDNK